MNLAGNFAWSSYSFNSMLLPNSSHSRPWAMYCAACRVCHRGVDALGVSNSGWAVAQNFTLRDTLMIYFLPFEAPLIIQPLIRHSSIYGCAGGYVGDAKRFSERAVRGKQRPTDCFPACENGRPSDVGNQSTKIMALRQSGCDRDIYAPCPST